MRMVSLKVSVRQSNQEDVGRVLPEDRKTAEIILRFLTVYIVTIYF